MNCKHHLEKCLLRNPLAFGVCGISEVTNRRLNSTKKEQKPNLYPYQQGFNRDLTEG